MKLSQVHEIYRVIAGSHAHGMANEASDLDLRGIMVAPKRVYHGFLDRVEQIKIEGDQVTDNLLPFEYWYIDERELVSYEIRKYFRLTASANPNVLPYLFVPRHCVVKETKWSKLLVKHRHKFLSKAMKHSYSGMAYSQLKRMKTHRGWLQDPIEDKPARGEFGLPERSLLPPDIRKAILFGEIENPVEVLSPEAVAVLDAERRYNAAKIAYDQYQNWKKNRNPKRAALEAKVGYDSKHGAVAIKTMRQAIETMTTGELIVDRPDAKELLVLKNGGWSYERLIEEAGRLEAELEELYDSEKCVLPHKPDRKFLDELCQEIVEGVLNERS